jgi:hypothetical protein
VNANLQIKKNGTTTWETISTIRGVFIDAMDYYINTLSIPPVLYVGEQGDRIRILVHKPYYICSGSGCTTGYLGGTHANPSITAPTGGKYSRAIKIVAIQ